MYAIALNPAENPRVLVNPFVTVRRGYQWADFSAEKVFVSGDIIDVDPSFVVILDL